MSLTALALTRTVKERALELGFDRVAVGPAYNAAHGDHFHFDRGPFSRCR